MTTTIYTGNAVPPCVNEALAWLESKLNIGPMLNSPNQLKDYLRLRLAPLDYEVFCVVFLDSQFQLISIEDMFRGSLTQTSVYPREIVKRALALNAGAVALAHNHPSGNVEPSRADECLTQTLKTALALVDVRVLDHIVVTAGGATSFVERGLL